MRRSAPSQLVLFSQSLPSVGFQSFLTGDGTVCGFSNFQEAFGAGFVYLGRIFC
jgi:hypothetical protein